MNGFFSAFALRKYSILLKYAQSLQFLPTLNYLFTSVYNIKLFRWNNMLLVHSVLALLKKLPGTYLSNMFIGMFF